MTEIILPADELEGTEATLSNWLINIGDAIEKGQPILELETDKVSMEICAPEAGILKVINIQPGEKVETDSVLGIIVDSIPTTENEIVTPQQSISEQIDEHKTKSADKELISPAVRRLLKEHSLNIKLITGTGRDGRVNREDVMLYLSNHKDSHSSDTNSKLVPHTTMRKSIANHMVESLLKTSPHVTSIFEMDMSNVIEHRKWHKKEFLQQGVNLTFTAYFLSAMAQSVSKVPEVNAKFHQDALELFSDINIGVGTALGDSGIVVPVVQQVQSLNLLEIASALTIQTEKARKGILKPTDMKNGTLTISNHGVSGSLIATPIIINQPQVAILGIGKLEKRVVVIEQSGKDSIEIRPKCYVTLSIDHRALDAHQTNLYLSEFVETIENWGV
jgi:2-oxoglutarate dehydrogenase E2 component (dihydrolipoamide succinyltransferase)